jgi:antigen flippase
MTSRDCNNELSTPWLKSVPQSGETVAQEKQSYGEILTSSALIGGCSILNIAIGIIRTKAMAVLLGPAGVGLLALYGSIADLYQNLAGMGVNSSGVRQIAEAVGSENPNQIARTTVVLRRVSILLGIVGAAFLVIFSRQVSNLTFGTSQHATAISILSIAVLFRLVSAGQGALIQGMRRISDLAKMGALGALFGTTVAIPIVYFFREKGVVPSLIGVAGMTIVTSWWYSRKVGIETPVMTLSESRQEATALLKLGFAFMASGLMTMGVAYAVRIMVLRRIGFEATGLYQSAWTLGGLYVGFILQAMVADFYPRLTASVKDNVVCNRLVNEQALVGLLLAGPGVIATLTFAPLVVTFFYAPKFSAAVGILRWICLGATLQVISWPMGFIIVAKGRQALFFFSELAWTIVAVALAWFSVRSFGLNGAGIAFFGSYLFHIVMTYAIVYRLSGFRWSTVSRETGLFFLPLIGIVFCGFYILPVVLATAVGIVAVILSGAYSVRILRKLIPLEELPHPMRRLIARFGVVSSASTVA